MNGLPLGLAALVLVAASMGVWFWLIQRVAIPEDRRGFVAIWLVGAGLGIAALTREPGWVGGVAAVAALVVGLFATTLVFISPQRVADDAIREGEPLRDFTALDEHGREFALASTAGRPLLLKFFRGHW